MTKDSHYYAVLAFARSLGFKKEIAHQIAYASQFVDDAKINRINLSLNFEQLDYKTINDKPCFYNMATCHTYLNIKTLNYAAMTANTTAFHFVPGCSGKTFTRKIRCKQKNPVIDAIIRKALPEADPVKFGMLLHSFADTFAHQGFSGIISRVNDIKKCEPAHKVPGENIFFKGAKAILKKQFDNFFDYGMPAYGHGQATIYPDQPYLQWSYIYEYLDEDNELDVPTVIDNRKRFVAAFFEIEHLLQKYLELHPHFKDEQFTPMDCKSCFKTLLLKGTVKQRIKNWQKYFLKNNLFNEDDIAFSYNDQLWLQEAFSDYHKKKYNKRQVDKAKPKLDFAESSWYKFYLAVHWYKPLFFQECKNKGVFIPNEYGVGA